MSRATKLLFDASLSGAHMWKLSSSKEQKCAHGDIARLTEPGSALGVPAPGCPASSFCKTASAEHAVSCLPFKLGTAFSVLNLASNVAHHLCVHLHSGSQQETALAKPGPPSSSGEKSRNCPLVIEIPRVLLILQGLLREPALTAFSLC